ncbi:hypothetical protein [Williamsia sp. 1135]|uniref:hypothetical protein n=1 Tax=Williamsia sp. 1135 TaxID=1889262 RepID=UPI000A1044C5|nr:hypothetical protein [Williamsia sp. 1135]ORM35500.1 hypothetical protein BFL43_09270 [Williamsia sp. 1135]
MNAININHDAGPDWRYIPSPLPWQGAIGVAASGIVAAALAHYTAHAARSGDGAFAAMMGRLHDVITGFWAFVTGPAVLTLLALAGAAGVVAVHLVCARRYGLAPASPKQYREAISAAALSAAGVFAAGYHYTAIESKLTAPSSFAEMGAVVCLAITGGAVIALRR